MARLRNCRATRWAVLYLLNTQGTPNDACLLGRSLNDSGFRQAELDTLAAVQGWYTNNQHG
jgi:hypothetical protein